MDSLDVARVWAADPVGFALLTHPPYQYVAFYDADRRLTIAQRKLDDRTWTFNQLPDTTGWDSHNFIALTADGDGYLHLCADMHVMPLKYFRTTKPWDASSFARIDYMTGSNETHCTYPEFFFAASNQLLFTYRDGHSGGGNQIYNSYDLKTKTWSRFLDAPLTDGRGTNNAYFDGPRRGPDGWYHLAWMWRHTPDASTCHDVSYARSRDMKHWETSAGKPLTLPIRTDNCEIVDPIPEHDGLGGVRLGLDGQGRPTISYCKDDANGYTQPFIARLENGRWVLHQVADWQAHGDQSGTGTLARAVSIGRVTAQPDGTLTEEFKHFKYGEGTWVLDPDTLRVMGKVTRQFDPPGIDKVEGHFPDLQVHWEGDSSPDAAKGESPKYLLRWETLKPHNDHPRTGKLPEPSMLKVMEVKSTES
jgi:BNR repeat-containing family member